MTGVAVFFCGLACSGKSTLARYLEAHLPAVRYSVDEHVLRRHAVTVFDERLGHLARAARNELWERGLRDLDIGRHVLFDWSLWSRVRRKEWANRAAAAGHEHLIVFLDVPVHELEERLRSRNRDLPQHVHSIPIEELERFAPHFETPLETEGLNVVTVGPKDSHSTVLGWIRKSCEGDLDTRLRERGP